MKATKRMKRADLGRMTSVSDLHLGNMVCYRVWDYPAGNAEPRIERGPGRVVGIRPDPFASAADHPDSKVLFTVEFFGKRSEFLSFELVKL